MTTITERGGWSNGTVDERGKRVFSNGLNERGRKVFGVTVQTRVQIGTVKVNASSGTIIIPVYQPLSTDVFRMQTTRGTGAFLLVATTDPKASPIRIKTKTGVMSVSK